MTTSPKSEKPRGYHGGGDGDGDDDHDDDAAAFLSSFVCT